MEVIAEAVAPYAILRVEDVRHPHIWRFPDAEDVGVDGVREAWRHDPDDLKRHGLAGETRADNIRCSAEPSLPEAVADHRDLSAALNLVVDGEGAPQQRCGSE